MENRFLFIEIFFCFKTQENWNVCLKLIKTQNRYFITGLKKVKLNMKVALWINVV